MGASYSANCIDSLKNYTSKDQGQTGTCFAYAIAGIIVLASERVHGRKKLNFYEIKDKIVKNYSSKGGGGDTHNILLNTGLLSEYRLRCREIDIYDAIEILRKENPRPIIATFYLNANRWNSLSNYYRKFPDGILTSKDLEAYYDPNQKSTSGGHAVIIMSFDGSAKLCLEPPPFSCFYFNIVNSWGDNWANKGFFKVSCSTCSEIEFKYYDVYWLESDLTKEEKEQYKRDFPYD